MKPENVLLRKDMTACLGLIIWRCESICVTF
jgi:hypothetical protein